jgi:hypothetical protein
MYILSYACTLSVARKGFVLDKYARLQLNNTDEKGWNKCARTEL